MRRRHVGLLLLRGAVAVALAAATTVVVVQRPMPPAVPATAASLPVPGGLVGVRPPDTGFYLGAAVNVQPGQTWPQAFANFEQQTGRQLPLHRMFQQWQQQTVTPLTRWDVAGGRLPALSLNAPPPWAEIARGEHDADIVAQAQAFKEFGAPVLLTFNHEPELDSPELGSPADYVAAWRHWVDIYRSEGATNVSFNWILLAASFNRPAVARSYYPGDDYVDWLGVDGYNWFTCQSFPWRSFAEVFAGFRTWAATRDKPVIIAEVGSAEDDADPLRKARWINDMGTTLSSWPQVKAVAWYSWYPKPEPGGQDCRFRAVSSQPALDAWRAVGALPVSQSRPG
ncbi:MAG TPA: hypothetical protein VFR07_08460 [Mycobacteriales bacterium]|jgi:hypothetical protein|nr:hypothetical protein [Mycobacteriales bacterium]